MYVHRTSIIYSYCHIYKIMIKYTSVFVSIKKKKENTRIVYHNWINKIFKYTCNRDLYRETIARRIDDRPSSATITREDSFARNWRRSLPGQYAKRKNDDRTIRLDCSARLRVLAILPPFSVFSFRGGKKPRAVAFAWARILHLRRNETREFPPPGMATFIRRARFPVRRRYSELFPYRRAESKLRPRQSASICLLTPPPPVLFLRCRASSRRVKIRRYAVTLDDIQVMTGCDREYYISV